MKMKMKNEWKYNLILPIEYEKIIKTFCIDNNLSIKEFIKNLIDSKLKEIKYNERSNWFIL